MTPSSPQQADYFRRWHGSKANSVGLMVHKTPHHFDLVNWRLSANPVTLTAEGDKPLYAPAMAKRLGLASRHDRCLTYPEADECTFRLDLAGNSKLKELHLDQENFDRYFRVRCAQARWHLHQYFSAPGTGSCRGGERGQGRTRRRRRGTARRVFLPAP